MLKLMGKKIFSFFCLSKPVVHVEYLSVIFILQVSKACVDKALEVGINFFDTAEVRNTSDQILDF